VYPREVEEVLAQCPGVREAAVLGLPDADLGERVTAAVVADDGALTADAVITFCRERLAPYKKPREVVFCSALPRVFASMRGSFLRGSLCALIIAVDCSCRRMLRRGNDGCGSRV